MRNEASKIPGFGDRLKGARLDAELTQQAVADELGLTIRTYQRYEAGITEPTLNHLVSLCITLDVSADYLLGLAGAERAGGR